MKLNTVKTSGMRAQAGVKQTSTTEQLKRESHACKLKQGPTRDVVLACATGTATLPLAEAGTEGIVDVSPQHRTRGAFRIDSHLMDTLQPKTSVAACVASSQRLAVTTEQNNCR